MSFASEVKNELSRVETEKKCCQLAEIAGFLRVSGSIGLAGLGKFKIIVTSENPAVIRHYKKLLHDYFDVETNLEVGESSSVGKKRAYKITIDADNRSEQILRETGILLVREGNNYISDGIYDGIVRSKCCKRAYLRGIFMGAGTMSDPEKSYHLEIVCGTETLSHDLKKLINSFVDLQAREFKRGKNFVVYMKKADYVADMLGIVGADTHSLVIENTLVEKSVKNEANRMANCDNANTDRMVAAAMKQIMAVEKIEEKKSLSWLPEKLREVALLRKEHPDISIKELGEMCDPPLKKSGINSRLKKIEEIASKL
ncbi:MAG: DNA-binding protein WhiA [Anaerovoracaceae bacterium]|nr:DNA-binding protein WhiA [Anaerovoracaceae bacterium]